MPAGLFKKILLLALLALNVACYPWSKGYIRQHVDPGSCTELAL